MQTTTKMDTIQKKANTLSEALPYIQKYSGKIFVIKYGGNAMIDQDMKEAVMADIALLKHVGISPIVVHGGGPSINKEMRKAHVKPVFVNGLRYTNKQTMQIVKRVSDQINKEIVQLLNKQKCKAENLTQGLLHTKIKDKHLGLVGEITSVDKKKLFAKIAAGKTPIISPIGIYDDQFTNINADTVAAKVAEAVGAEKLTILTDVDGVYEKGKLIPHLSIQVAKKGIKQGFISKGMIPKVLACSNAVQKGVKKAHLINGTSPHSILLEFFTDKGIGTEIVKNGN